jgi:LysR family nod box-dependent transcriptional activator
MRLQGLDLNLLICLDALLDERSVSKAAHRLFLTQSAMSLALARLRDYFHDQLLHQVGKTMVPTPAALALVQPVRDVLIQIQSIASSTVEFDPAKSDRKITVMASDFTMDILLKKVVPRLAQLAPRMRLDFPSLTSNFGEEFARGQIDFLITPEVYISDEHPSELLFSEEFTCVVWSKNTLVGDRISFEQYKKMGHVCVNLGGWRVPTYEEWFLKRYGEVRRIEVIVPSFALAVQLVTGTQRIATGYVRQARMYARQYSLRLIDPPFRIPPANLCLQWHKHMDHDPALIWFRGLLKAALGNAPAA